MSRQKRTDKIYEIAINKFIRYYFDDKYPNTEYKIIIEEQQPLKQGLSLDNSRLFVWIVSGVLHFSMEKWRSCSEIWRSIGVISMQSS